jgi:quercetin dioxygenase-like cupin family protein
MTPNHVVAEVFSQFAGRGIVPTSGAREAVHIGEADLPYVYAGEGSEIQLLHVDLHQGLWISKTRFQPGIEIARHFHTGCVFAVTLRGEWYYKEYPESVNRAGSYLFEPAGSVHTLVVPEQDGVTEAWFAIWGANVLLDDAGSPTAIVDAQRALDVYRAFCRAQGTAYDRLLVIGESK